MLRILFIVECDDCGKALPYVHFSTIVEGRDWEDWEDWVTQISRHAQRFLSWKVEPGPANNDELHFCPECLDQEEF